MGMMASQGERIFFADADRAMPFGEFQKLNAKFDYLADTYPDLIVIGSRAHLEKDSIAQRSFFRTLLMKVLFKNFFKNFKKLIKIIFRPFTYSSTSSACAV